MIKYGLILLLDISNKGRFDEITKQLERTLFDAAIIIVTLNHVLKLLASFL